MTSYNRDYFTLSAHQKPTVGDSKMSVINRDHMGWLVCDGRLLSVTEFEMLFNVIGYSFGGAGTQFQLPDAAGRVPGITGSGSGLTTRALGDSVGEEEHTLIIAEMPSHNHGTDSNLAPGVPSNNTTTSNGLHTHGYVMDSNGSHSHTGTTDASGLHNHDTNAVGGQGNYGLALANGVNTVTSTDSSDGELNVWTLPGALAMSNSGSHTHTFTTSNAGLHNHTLTISNAGLHAHVINPAGGDAPHNNMQPTLFVGNLFIYSGKTTYGSYPYTAGTNIY